MMWTTLEYMIWAALAAASILTIAILLDAVSHRGRLSRVARQAQGALADAIRALHHGGEDGVDHASVQRSLQWLRHPVAQFYAWALDPHRDGIPELKAASLLEEADGGRIRTAQFVARLSPLLGLGGTVVGLIQQFVLTSNSGSQSMSLDAFGYCLFTTLAGIGIAVLALTASALVLEPALRRVQFDLTEAVLTVQGHQWDAVARGGAPSPEGRGEPCSVRSLA